MRVVIACCGLEHVKRGYESFSRELFDALSGQVDVMLCKGSGKHRPREVVLPCLRRDFLMRFMNTNRAFYWEQITFAVSLVAHLILNRADIVHFSEGNLGNALVRFLRWTGLGTVLLQSNGGPISARHFRPEVFIHQVCEDGLNDALAYGIPPARMHLVPYGIAPERFSTSEDKATVRQSFGMPKGGFVILSLAALNKEHKRLDYLIREVALIQDGSVFLVMAGEPSSETGDLRALAAELLPGRHAFLTVPRARIPELLATADLFVHTALAEGFGMVLIEACAAGVPVVCHDSRGFRWVLGDAALFTDMAAPGALTARIQQVIGQEEILRHFRLLGTTRVDECFSWKVLAPRYIAMYESILAASQR